MINSVQMSTLKAPTREISMTRHVRSGQAALKRYADYDSRAAISDNDLIASDRRPSLDFSVDQMVPRQDIQISGFERCEDGWW